MATSPRRERRTIRRLTGALYAASGCLLLVNFRRCTSWGNAYPEGSPEWWIAVLGAMFQTSDARLINGALLVTFSLGIFHWIRGFLPEFRGLPTTTRGLMIAVAIVVLTGPIANQVGTAFGIGHAAVLIWDIAKWPVLVVIVSVMFSLLYKASPNVRQPAFRWVSAGGILAVILWLIASGLFAVYVSFSGS